MRLRADVDRLVAAAVQRFGGVDILVNNAGIGAFANVADMTDDDWLRVIETNLTGVFYCCNAAIPQHAHAWWRLDHQHQQPGGEELLRRRRRLLRVEGRR